MTLAQISPLSVGADHLAFYDWRDSDAPVAYGTVLLVHGLGEHMGRYDAVAQVLQQAGWRVYGYDHHGHGRSSGKRGDLPTPQRLLDDLVRVIDHVRASPRVAAQPLVLLGHSMGGLVVARALAGQLRPVHAAILSSPALAADTNAVQKFLLSTLPHVAPHVCVDNGLKLQWLARDPDVVQAYRKDPLVHRKISAALAAWILQEGPRTVAQAAQWRVPTLLVYAGQDRLVNPQGSADFAAAAPAHVVQAQCFAPMYHEIFNDPERAQVFEVVTNWLNSVLRA